MDKFPVDAPKHRVVLQYKINKEELNHDHNCFIRFC